MSRIRKQNSLGFDVSSTSGAAVSETGEYRIRPKSDGSVLQYSYNGGAWADYGTSGALKWNALTDPDGHQALTMAAYKSTWTWSATSGAQDLVTLTTGSDDTGTGVVVAIRTPGTANAKSPLAIYTRGQTDAALAVTNAGLTQLRQTLNITAAADVPLFDAYLIAAPSSSSAALYMAGKYRVETSTAQDTGALYGLSVAATHAQDGALTSMIGQRISLAQSGDGTTTQAIGLDIGGDFSSATTGVTTEIIGVRVALSLDNSHDATTVTALEAGVSNLSSETVTTIYGLRVAHAVFGNVTNSYGVVVESTGGYSGFGLGSPTATLHASGSVKIDLGSDATGDIFYRNSGGALTRLGVGTNGYVLTLAGGLPSWAASGSGANPAGSGSEIQYRVDGTTFGAVTGSSVSGANVALTGTLSVTASDSLVKAYTTGLFEVARYSGASYPILKLSRTDASNADIGDNFTLGAVVFYGQIASSLDPLVSITALANESDGSSNRLTVAATYTALNSWLAVAAGNIDAPTPLYANVSTSALASNAAGILFVDEGDTDHARIALRSAYSSTGGPIFQGERAHYSGGLPAATQSGQILVGLGGKGHDGSAYTSFLRGFIAIKAGENYSGTAQGSYFSLELVPSGVSSTTRAEVLQISGTGAFSFADGVRQTFNPNGTNAGLNVGAHTADPSSLSNGDLWYDSTNDLLRARINGSSVSLGASGSSPAGSGSEIQYRSSGSAFGAVTSSSISGANVTLGGSLTLNTANSDVVFSASTFDHTMRMYDDSLGGQLRLGRARNTRSSPNNISNDDTLGIIDFEGRVGGSFVRYGRIFASYNSAGSALHLIPDTSGGTVRIWGTTLTVDGTIAFTDNLRQTFNPGATNSGLNVGAYAGVPSSLSDGDIWYDSTATSLKARINGATVALGGGAPAGSGSELQYRNAGAFGAVSSSSVSGANITLGGDFAIVSDAATLLYHRVYHASAHGRLWLQRGRGTAASPTAIQSGDTLFRLDFAGQHDTSTTLANTMIGASITAEAQATWDASNTPTDVAIRTKSGISSSSGTVAGRFTHNQRLGVGSGIANTDISHVLTVSGNARFYSANTDTIFNSTSQDVLFYQYDDAFGGQLSLLRARGDRSSPSNISNDDTLGIIDFYGRVSGTFTRYSRIFASYNSGGSTLNLIPDTSGGTVHAWGDVLTVDGWLGVRVAAPTTVVEIDASDGTLGASAAAFLIADDDNTDHARLALRSAMSGTGGPIFQGERANYSGGAAATQSGQILVGLGGKGHDGSAYTSFLRGFIAIKAGENYSGTAQGSYFSLELVPSGVSSTTRAEVLQISGTGAFSFADGVRQTFNPNGTSAGLNVGAHTADPSSLSNGDLWYDSTGNLLRARINGASVSLGAGGAYPAGSGSEIQYRSSGTAFAAITSSSVSGANVTLGGSLTLNTANSDVVFSSTTFDHTFRIYDDSLGGQLRLGRARNTRSSPSNISNDDTLGIIDFEGRVGGSFVRYGRIFASYNSGGSSLHLIPDTSGGTVRIWGTTLTIDGTLSLTDDIRQTFNPGTTNAGLNVGSLAGNPSSPSNGDIWYNSSGNALNARINGATVSLGAGGGSPAGSGSELQYRNAGAFGAISNTSVSGDDVTFGGIIQSLSADGQSYMDEFGAITANAYGSDAADVPTLTLGRARGTRTSNTTISSGDYLGRLKYRYSDGSFMIDGIVAEAKYTNTNRPTYEIKAAISDSVTTHRQILNAYKALTDNTSTQLFKVAFTGAENKAVGGLVQITVIVRNATDVQCVSKVVQWQAAHWNSGGFGTMGYEVLDGDIETASTGTLTTTFSAAGGDDCIFSITADTTLSSLTEFYCTYQIICGGEKDITLL